MSRRTQYIKNKNNSIDNSIETLLCNIDNELVWWVLTWIQNVDIIESLFCLWKFYILHFLRTGILMKRSKYKTQNPHAFNSHIHTCIVLNTRRSAYEFTTCTSKKIRFQTIEKWTQRSIYNTTWHSKGHLYTNNPFLWFLFLCWKID